MRFRDQNWVYPAADKLRQRTCECHMLVSSFTATTMASSIFQSTLSLNAADRGQVQGSKEKGHWDFRLIVNLKALNSKWIGKISSQPQPQDAQQQENWMQERSRCRAQEAFCTFHGILSGCSKVFFFFCLFVMTDMPSLVTDYGSLFGGVNKCIYFSYIYVCQ